MADGFDTSKGPRPVSAASQPLVQIDAALRRTGVPDAKRTRVTTHLQSLTGAELQRELLLLQHVLATPNAKPAIGTYVRVLDMAQESPRAAQRLPPEIRHALAKGVADPRATTTTGHEGILVQPQAELAAQTLVHMPQAQFQQAKALLERAGQGGAHGLNEARADAGAERAYILKFIAQRSERLRATPADANARGSDTEASRAMDEISGIADDMRAMSRTHLIRMNS
ncbi:hypothetical protein [Hyalangium minutum]|uniref:Uncharacterized protein n=1 Tax=Hyalangium minutum TaxID=394096 RepID=A0A085WXV8_9BACT|nr:hypothetical protein [Hyalangium minutum]KFE72521.1 hypothetical protein DB31_0784 [Hyalangium minutum]